MLQKNQEIPLTVDGMSAEGTGVGHHEGQAVFVSGTAVGDTVLCHIIKAKKNYAVGKAVAVLTASPDRVAPDCPVAGKCGGCCYRHLSYEAELRIKQQRVEDAFRRIAHLETPVSDIVGSAETLRYRNKAQFPVGTGRDGSPLIGFYAFNSHRIVPTEDCLLQPPAFKQVTDLCRHWMITNKLSAYNEETRKGLLRHLYVRQGYYSKELMVCLVVNSKMHRPAHVTELVEMLRSVDGFKTLVVNYNSENTNVILGKDSEIIFGNGYIEDTLRGCTFRISPRSFYQVNTAQTELLYACAEDFASLSPDDVLLDLYCGTGTIGLTMAKHVKKLYGVEIVPEAVEDAKQNAAANQIQNAAFLCGDASHAAEALHKDGVQANVILVDPPRKGLTEDLIHTISNFDPKRVVYVSCDPATLARDCARFAELGYVTQKIQPVDMFPRTAHVETVCLLVRRRNA